MSTEDQASGIPIPDLKHPNPKELLSQIAQLQRERQEERIKYEKRLTEVETRGKLDLDRLRGATSTHTRDLESQNSALIKALAKLQTEVERLEKEKMALELRIPPVEPQPVTVPGAKVSLPVGGQGPALTAQPVPQRD